MFQNRLKINLNSNTLIGIILMCLSALFVSGGQLFWKLSYNYGLLFVFLGFFLYGIGALLMLLAYSKGKLSVLQPILSLNYVFSVFFSLVVLNEPLYIVTVTGIFLIIVGVILLVGDDSVYC